MYDITYVLTSGIKKYTNELIYKTEMDSQAQRTNLLLLGGRVVERDRQGVWDWNVHIAIIKIESQQGPNVEAQGRLLNIW